MNPFVQELLVATLRHWLTMTGTWLVAEGYLAGDTSVERYATGLAVLFISFMWTYWNKYKGRINFLMALQTPVGTSETDVKAKAAQFPPNVLALLLALSLGLTGCAGKTAPVVVAQSALGIGQSVEALQVAAIDLHKTGTLTTPQAIAVQTRLLRVNAQLATIIPYLKAVDRLSQSGVVMTQAELDALIAQVYLALNELGLLSADVPGSEETKAFLSLVRTAQTTMTTTMIELARVRVALEQ